MRFLGIENLAASTQHLKFALSAACLSTASRRQMDAVVVEGVHHGVALLHFNDVGAIDGDCHLAARTKIFLCDQQHYHEHEYYCKEYSDAGQYITDVHCLNSV